MKIDWEEKSMKESIITQKEHCKEKLKSKDEEISTFDIEKYEKSLSKKLKKIKIKKIYKPLSLKRKLNRKTFNQVLSPRPESLKDHFPLLALLNKSSKESDTTEEQNFIRKKKNFSENFKMPENENIYDVKYKVKLRFFYDIKNIVVKLFKGEILEKNDLNIDFKFQSKKILKLILKKKFKNLQEKEFAIEKCFLSVNFEKDISMMFKKPIENLKLKRREEENKLIYKFVLKKLKTKFFNNNNLEHKKKNDKYFFENFFDRNLNNNLYNKIFFENNIKVLNKNFTVKIFKIIVSSKKFKNEIIFYLENFFLKAYEKKIESKFYNIFLSIERNSFSFEECEKKIYEFLEKNKVKFPWTLSEVEFGIKNFIKMLNSF